VPDDDTPFGFETLAIHAGQTPDLTTGAVVTPIYATSTFSQSSVGEHKGYDYSRTGNPTRSALETCLAALEATTFGCAFSSGMSAIDAVLRLLHPGDHVLIGDDVYGGTYRLLSQVHAPAGLRFDPISLEDPADVARALEPTTRMVWVESPSNPMLRIADIAALAELAHAHGALLVVDNTFATPYLQQPLVLGADIVVHSTTKYLGGHSDVVGGFVATSQQELSERIAFLQNAVGAVPSPFDCFLVLRGVKTLAVRMERHCANAARVAEVLRTHPDVEHVYYPGLPEHDGHTTARAQMRAFGGMVSFTVRGGEERSLKVASSTSIFTLAESLGAVESLIEHPGRMTHASLSDSILAVDPSLLRLSVGLEDVDDLVADLRSALRTAFAD
jgi:cystathionine gamma-synthase